MIRPQSCPICEKVLTIQSATESEHFPFCSVRCRQIDLYRWSEGKYAIVEPVDPELLEMEQDIEDSLDMP